MHRNTLIVVSFLAVIAALLVGFNLGRNLPKDTATAPTPTPAATPTPTLTYISNRSCGVSYQYPNTLTPIEASSGGTILSSSQKPDDTIVIICQEDIPRVPLTQDRMESMTLTNAAGTASVSAVLYHDASPKDGSPIDKLIFTHPSTGLDVFIGGIGPVYDQFITTLKLN